MREDWVEIELGKLCKFSQGVQVPKGKQYTEDIENRVRFLRIIDFTQGKDEPRYIDKPNDINIVAKGDISMVRYGATTGFVCSGISGAIANNIFRIIPEINISKRYLYFFLKSPIFYQMIISRIKGAAMPAISFGLIKPIIFPLPPLVEQKAIVKKIEELFSSLDSGIADLKKAQDQLIVYRQAVLKKAFEGELTKEWREKQTSLPSADELLEQIKEERQKYQEQELSKWKDAVKLWKNEGANDKKPAKPKFIKELISLTDDELEKLPTLNKYWHWVKADKIASHEASSLKAGPFGSSLKKEFYKESGYKIYGQEQVIANNHKIGYYYVNQEKYDSLINCAVKPYDILISLVGTVGKVLVLPKDCEDGIINPRLVKISLNKFYDSIFFKYYFESAFLKSLYSLKAHGATMDILNLGIIKELPYPLCSKQEQHQIVQEIESRLSVCDNIEESIKESLEKAQALRQSILKKAFEGKLLSEEEITACKKHKDYQPASVLLEKIKAENKQK
ncbi:restriction endonuclease subunit S [Maribacter sp. MJ134]|uniref:restriction endonuclease subunit S n=1 Tax=Maribacter sp. MJ134 TaxID=2496865 RepID=UPI000F81E429|nr:restriction endonuclease subunit S [Maribacter sp. MJ134]AZQ59994.1 restriction endonuclease subunit S [Maribacter sp. MJ134]